jgi:hypothetical protein
VDSSEAWESKRKFKKKFSLVKLFFLKVNINKEKVLLVNLFFLKIVSRYQHHALSWVKQQQSRWNDLKWIKLPGFTGEAEALPLYYLRLKKVMQSKGASFLLRKDESTKAQMKDPESFSKIDGWGQMILLGSLSEGASYLVQDCNTTYKMVEKLLAQYDSSSASSVLFKFNKALRISRG